MALSTSDRRMFFERGTVRIPRVFSRYEAERMVQQIWTLLHDKCGIRPDNPQTWTERQPTGFQSLTRAGVFNAIAGPALHEVLTELLGQGAWNPNGTWGAPLVTFPEKGKRWDVPRAQWHLDFPARLRPSSLPGIRILAFLAPIAPGGGGTVVATGTHLLVEKLVAAGKAEDGHSTTVRRLLAETYPDLSELWWGSPNGYSRIDRFMTEGVCADGVMVRVEELTGEAGDVVFMHPWTFHAPAPNCNETPRMMVSHSVYRI